MENQDSSENQADYQKLFEATEQLHVQVRLINNHLQKLSSSSGQTSDHVVSFMISESEQIAEVWRYAGSRMETGINLYLTMIAAFATGVLIFSSKTYDPQALVAVTIPIAFLLVIAGHVLSLRIIATARLSAENAAAQTLIRAYFLDLDNSIRPYLFLPSTPDLKVTTARFLFVLSIWMGLLAGFVCSGILLLLFPQLALPFTIVTGILVWFLFSFLYLRKQRAAVNSSAKQLTLRLNDLRSSLESNSPEKQSQW
jgi:hypothetical protein